MPKTSSKMCHHVGCVIIIYTDYVGCVIITYTDYDGCVIITYTDYDMTIQNFSDLSNTLLVFICQ
jgi:hypothetical protein